MHPAIAFDEVTRSYDGRCVLDHVTFNVPAGSVSGLLGPNGAGKTTLMSILAGFIHADSGTVQVQGLDHRDPQLRGRIGILPQDAAFQADLSILDQLTYLARLGGADPANAVRSVAEVLERVGLSDWLGRRSTELSHGMYKRLGVAQAFLGDPQVVLLDEPTAGLDPANAAAVRTLIKTFVAGGHRTVVVSSHDLAEMQELCQHVAILAKGRLVSCGPVSGLLATGRLLRLRPSRALTQAELDTLAVAPWCTAAVAAADGWYDLTVRGDDAACELEAQRWLAERGIAVRASALGQSLAEHFRDVTAR